MNERGRVLVLGPAELRASVALLGFETTAERPQVAVIDLRDAGTITQLDLVEGEARPC